MSQPKDDLTKSNSKSLFNIESNILWSRGKTSATLSQVEQNRFNFLGAISGQIYQNRALINQSTDDIFRERYNSLRKINPENETIAKHKEGLIVESRIDVLEHRHKLNKAMLDIGLMMASINRQLREINETLMDTNDRLNTFNNKNLEKNRELFASHHDSTNISEEDALALAEKNQERLGKLTKETEELLLSIAKTSGEEEKIKLDYTESTLISQKCADEIEETRKAILENHKNFESSN
jgi:hypothetical protein